MWAVPSHSPGNIDQNILQRAWLLVHRSFHGEDTALDTLPSYCLSVGLIRISFANLFCGFEILTCAIFYAFSCRIRSSSQVKKKLIKFVINIYMCESTSNHSAFLLVFSVCTSRGCLRMSVSFLISPPWNGSYHSGLKWLVLRDLVNATSPLTWQYWTYLAIASQWPLVSSSWIFFWGRGLQLWSCGIAVALLWMLPSLSFKTRKAHFMKTLLLSFLSFFFVNMLIAAW